MKQIFLAMTLVTTVIVSLPSARCQIAVEAWVQRYHEAGSGEDRPLAIAVASNGNAIVTGTSRDTNFYDLKHWVTIAYSSSGVPLWTNRYRGPGGFYDDQPNAVAVDAAGNAFVAGVSFNMDGDQDYVVIKYSTTGVALWTKRYNGPGNGNDGANAVAVDSFGNVIVTGLSPGTNGLSSYIDYATIKYSGAGVPLWTNRYNGPTNNLDEATDVAVDSRGNVIVTGISLGYAYADYLTIKYSSAGVPLWTNRYNGAADNDDRARALVVDGNGNAFVTGAGGGGGGGDGGFATIKYSNAGVPLWTNRYKGPSIYSYTDLGRAIAVDGGGNVIVTGDSYRDFVTRDIATIAYSNAGVPLAQRGFHAMMASSIVTQKFSMTRSSKRRGTILNLRFECLLNRFAERNRVFL